MKNVLVFLFVGLCLNADAQEVIGKKTQKRAAAKTKSETPVVTTEAETFKSRNGVIKVNEMDNQTKIDSIQTSDVQAPHVNKNYNESTPPLSPSNGSK